MVDDLDYGRFCLAFGPGEADAPLVVDSDAELTDPIASQAFQPVALKSP
ncbi:MAG TPA: hypothetical protein VD767_03900 [Thermomicrobiales bacterium]|nr:hypothetical protein [Thermomicrobiales bacterium]